MIANVTDEHELRVGVRQEGLLFSANMFVTKSASGLSPPGRACRQVASFPKNAQPATVDPTAVRHLGSAHPELGAV
jgi:hypothetical protein